MVKQLHDIVGSAWVASKNKNMEVKPNPRGEKRFYDKLVSKELVPNIYSGSDYDDLFRGTNVKMAPREAERHGYSPGKDAEVYEDVDQDGNPIDESNNRKYNNFEEPRPGDRYAHKETRGEKKPRASSVRASTRNITRGTSGHDYDGNMTMTITHDGSDKGKSLAALHRQHIDAARENERANRPESPVQRHLYNRTTISNFDSFDNHKFKVKTKFDAHKKDKKSSRTEIRQHLTDRKSGDTYTRTFRFVGRTGEAHVHYAHTGNVMKTESNNRRFADHDGEPTNTSVHQGTRGVKKSKARSGDKLLARSPYSSKFTHDGSDKAKAMAEIHKKMLTAEIGSETSGPMTKAQQRFSKEFYPGGLKTDSRFKMMGRKTGNNWKSSVERIHDTETDDHYTMEVTGNDSGHGHTYHYRYHGKGMKGHIISQKYLNNPSIKESYDTDGSEEAIGFIELHRGFRRVGLEKMPKSRFSVSKQSSDDSSITVHRVTDKKKGHTFVVTSGGKTTHIAKREH